ncbi:MAG: dephospho-CoA kinase [Pikeienuella sp.]
MTIRIALTGSIGMGKSTTAQMFRDVGAMVWDADEAVHRLYEPGGEGTKAISKIAPTAVTDQGVDRIQLRSAILADAALLKEIEAAIHPLVGKDRASAIETATAQDYGVVVLDIPLLFETGAPAGYDAIVVASADAETQRQRVLERPGMTVEAFEGILAKQTPDVEKRSKADFIIDTGNGLDQARAQVAEIMAWADKKLQAKGHSNA